MIYQKTVPEPVFKVRSPLHMQFFYLAHSFFQLVIELTNLDVSPSSQPAESGELPKIHVSEEGEEDEDETSPERTGPPSETSSQEWDNVTDPNSQPAGP